MVVGELAHVSLLNFVDDIDDLYSRGRIVISTLDGTGLKIKVSESLTAGNPVFGSQHWLEGLPAGAEECAFLIDEANIVGMLSASALLTSAEKAAQAFGRDLATKVDLADFKSPH